ncbi:hypothetical protein ACFW34_35115, partial [Streptomyces sp. NPDC058848]|uniref:hypothetical protein n=1 Tax=Streptomyces sp. NPDC058848 TaxID=3346650 RepID=UPI0036CA7597
ERDDVDVGGGRMSTPAVQLLNAAVTGTADAAGGLTLRIGPDSAKGPARWSVTRLGVRNEDPARRGQAPVPTCNVYLDGESAADLVDGTYDGSFDFSDCALRLQRGQALVAVWAGALPGDRLTLSVTGVKEGT